MDKYCCIPYCENYKRRTYNRHVTLYPPPYSEVDKAIWAKAFGININCLKNDQTRVCSLHFLNRKTLDMAGSKFDGVTKMLGNQRDVQSGSEVQIIDSSKFSNMQNTSYVPPPPYNVQPLPYMPTNPRIISDSPDLSQGSNMRTLLTCELLLDCQEDALSEVQQNYHSQEWLNYCKFNANIQDMSSVRVEEEKKPPSESLAKPELPFLIFSNTPAAPHQNIFKNIVNNTGQANPASIFIQIPSPAPVNSVANATTSAVVAIHGTQPIASNPAGKPTVFPVLLQKAAEEKAKPASLQQGQQQYAEEIFPVVLHESINDFVSKPLTKEQNIIPENVLSTSLTTLTPEEPYIIIDHKSTPAPVNLEVQQPASTSNQSNTVLFNNLEMNLHNQINAVPGPKNYVDASQYASDLFGDDSNGPKIVGVVSGNAGAQEYFKDYSTGANLAVNVITQKVDRHSPAPKADKEKSLPRMVSQWSIFSMQKTIAVISCGKEEASIRNLLKLRFSIPPVYDDKQSGVKLRSVLRESNYIALSIWWMIKKNYLPMCPPCETCKGKIFNVNSCYDLPENLCWTCVRCQTIFPVQRPDFFKRFPNLCLEEMMLLIYHWSCKSRLYITKKDVSVDDQAIFEFYSGLQEICGSYLDKFCALGKNSSQSSIVEVSAVKLGQFFVICAFCRISKLTRLKVITTEDACNSLAHIEAIKSMLGPFCSVITWKKISDEFLPNMKTLGADNSITSVLSSGRHILNASKYLGKTLVELFRNINHDELSLKTVQGFLDEVQWRDRFARLEESCFWNIWNEIARTNVTYTTEATFGQIHQQRYFYKQDLAFQMRWGPLHISTMTSKTYNLPRSCDPKKVEKAISACVTSSVLKIQDSMTSSTKGTESIKPVSVPTPKPIPDLNFEEKKMHPISIFAQINSSREREVPVEGSISAKELLSVKILFIDHPTFQESLRQEAMTLAQQLKKEGFLSKPVFWLVKKKLISAESSCYVCNGPAMLVESSKHSDHVSWICNKPNCMFENEFRRPTFFATFGFPLEVLFAVIYHWAVQSDHRVVMKSIPLNEHNIICIHRKLQKICSQIGSRPSVRIGGLRCVVEVALVKFANCFILGAMERSSRLSRFKAFPIIAKLHIDAIRKTLLNWLRPNTTVIVNSSKYFGSYCMKDKINLVFSDKNITDVKSKGYHTLTISQYLQNHMKTMFSFVKVQYLKAEVLQLYLDELVWRERYGRSPTLAFKNIMQDIVMLDSNNKGPGYASYSIDSSDISEAFLLLPQVQVVLEKLSEDVINRYLNPDLYKDDSDDDVEFLEIVEKKNIVKDEITISDDDEFEEVNSGQNVGELKSNENSVDNSSGSSSVSRNTDISFSLNAAHSTPGDTGDKDAAIPEKNAVEDMDTFTAVPEKSSVEEMDTSTAVPERSVTPLETKPPVASKTPPMSVIEKTTPIPFRERSVTNSSTLPLGKNVLVSVVSQFPGVPSSNVKSDFSSFEENSRNSSASLQLAFVGAEENEKPRVPPIRLQKSRFTPREFTTVNVKKKSTDKCYSHRNRLRVRCGDSEFQCIECKELVSPSHFVKMYTCDDCRYNVYTTFCQRAFAQHRAYVLFGRKVQSTNPDGGQYHRRLRLANSWHCSCGYRSREGNKLASHLVKCSKTTCYLSDEEDIEVDVLS